MANVLPPPPINDQPGSFVWLEWYRELRNYISQSGSVPWAVINFAGSNITDIATRSHNNLQVLQGGTPSEYYHLTNAAYNDIISGSYGSFYMDNGSQTVTVSAANTWYSVSAGMTGGSCSQFTFQNARELLCNRAGKYLVNWSMSFSVGVANQEIEGAVMINSTYQPNTTNHEKGTSVSTAMGISGTGIITLALNDTVKLAINNNSGANNVTIAHANLTLIRVGP